MANTQTARRKDGVIGTTCNRCGRKHLGEFVYLELNVLTGRYHTPGRVKPEESQGLFRFGKTCAHRALAYERIEDSLTNPALNSVERDKLKAALSR